MDTDTYTSTDSVHGTPKPVDTVICMDTDSLHSSPKLPALQHNDDDDDFPYLQQDEESLDTMSDKPIAQTSLPVRPKETELNSLSRNASLLNDKLDSPDTHDLELSHSDTMPDFAVRSGPRARRSLIPESSYSDDLEIPRPDTSKGLEEAACRFFRSNDEETVKLTRRSDAMPIAASNVAKAAPLRQNTSKVDRASNVEPRSHQSEYEPVVVVEPRPERPSEVDPSLYLPPTLRHRPDPIVHHLSIHNRPINLRQKIPVKELFSSPMHQLWQSKFDTFNHLQSEVANTLAHSDDSIIVSAPTGAGKTALFEMAMARFFASDFQGQDCHLYGSDQVTKRRKVVYVAPSKALCEERNEDWTRGLSDINVGIQCAMITGDAEPGDSFREVAASDVILTTPEKWDSLTRRWTENLFLFGSVKLLMIDEVHLLGDGSRGCCLESIVCRMKTIQRAARAASESYSEHAMSR